MELSERFGNNAQTLGQMKMQAKETMAAKVRCSFHGVWRCADSIAGGPLVN